jgi:hypothetical protein
MANESMILGKVRGMATDLLLPASREDEQPQLSGQGEQEYALGAAPYQEDVRQGRAFWSNTATAVASVTAIPTTAVAFAIYNNEPDGGRSYIITRVAAQYTVNTAIAQVHVGIIGCLGLVREAIPTTSAATIKQANGMGKLDTRARTIVGGTALPATTGIAANWFPLGASISTAVITLPGMNQMVEVDGRIIVPPGRYFAVHTLGSVTTTSAQMFIYWTEKQLLLG